MINEKIQQELDELFADDTITQETVKHHVVSIVSELEEEICELREKIENLEYHLGLTGVKEKP